MGSESNDLNGGAKAVKKALIIEFERKFSDNLILFHAFLISRIHII